MWLDKEVEYIKKKYAVDTVENISHYFYNTFGTYRTELAIRSQAQRLGLSKPHPLYKKNRS